MTPGNDVHGQRREWKRAIVREKGAMKVSRVERARRRAETRARHLAEAQAALEKAARHFPPEREWAREKVQTLIAEIRRLQIQLAEAPTDLEGGVR
jgi:uncharacterized protein YceH (UPF0502 family)